MPKTFDILKKRWREVAFLVLSPSIIQLIQRATFARNYHTILLLSSLFCTVLFILLFVFRIGFLRTAYLYGKQKQEIRTLFTIGKEFFVQLFLFGIIYGIPIGAATMVLSHILRVRLGIPSRLSFMLPLLLLNIIFIKIALLIPTLIITCKLNVINAFKALKNYRILEAKELLVLFAIQQVFGFAKLLNNFLADMKFVLFSVRFIETVITHLLTLAIAVSAVRFIADNIETTTEAIENAETENAENI